MKTFANANARDAKHAVALSQQARRDGKVAAFSGGGSDLLGLVKERTVSPDVLVNLRSIKGLDEVSSSRDGVNIGGLITLDALSRNPRIRREYTVLAEAAETVATPQIRNFGTLAGNVCQRPWCWYFRHPGFVCFKNGGRQCFAIPGNHRTYFSVLGRGICVMSHPSDLAPALMALGARVGIAGPGGRREVALDDFFLGARSVNETVLAPGELLTWVDVPAPSAGARSAFLKHRIRNTWDFALAEVAVSATPRDGRYDDLRIALGGVAPFPYRATAAERVLGGRPGGAAAIAEAAEAAVARARPLGMNGYKVDLTKALVRRALTALMA